ncbi:MAG: ADOP family duplicated permease [Gemmatimonadaceae bacterium]
MTAGWRRLLRIFGRDPARDIDAELRFHMETRVEDLVVRGATPDAAHAQALAEFGNMDMTRERLGAIDARIAARSRRAQWWEGIAQDLRHTLRGLARSPGFTVMVVVTLALGIGANAAVFSVLHRLFFATPAGVKHPGQVRRIMVSARYAGRPPSIRSLLNYPEFRGIAANVPEPTRIAGFVSQKVPYGRKLGGSTRPAEFAVRDYLGVLGLRPVIGRFFSGAELEVTGLTPVAVISWRLWRRDFGGSAKALGQSLDLGVHRYTIIGVAPGGFAGTGLDDVDLWLPFNCWTAWVARDPQWYDQTGTLMVRTVARVASTSAANALVPAVTHGLRTDGMAWDSTATAVVTPLRGAGSPEFFGRQSAIAVRLAAVAAIILLIAVANVANLLLGRAMNRRHETAVRLALGVSRRRLIAQTLSESVVVALLAGAAAALAAMWGAALLQRLELPNVSWGGTSFDTGVAWFAAAVSLLTGLAAGILPALYGSRSELMNSLKGDTRAGGQGRSAARSTLVIIQAALSVVLLAGAGLFVRSLEQVESIDLGYDVPHLLFASPDAVEDTAADRAITAQLPALAERLASVAGVRSTSLMYMPPLWGLSSIDTYLPDRDSLPGVSVDGPPLVLLGSPGFLATLGVRTVAGRLFTDADRAGAEPVLVVNQALASAYWPGQNALGKCLILHSRADPCRRIVGVAENAHMTGLVEKTVLAYYVPLGQAPEMRTAGTIAIRTTPGHEASVREAVASILRGTFGANVRPGVQSMDDLVDPDYQQWRVGASLFTVAGLLALLVAAVGIYSTMAYSVGQRTHEIGVRMALGARGANVARLVVGQGIRVVSVGIVLGILVALALGRFVSSLLYDTSPRDPAVLGLTAAALVFVAVIACLVPARRAARVDPMETLRAE